MPVVRPTGRAGMVVELVQAPQRVQEFDRVIHGQRCTVRGPSPIRRCRGSRDVWPVIVTVRKSFVDKEDFLEVGGVIMAGAG